MQAGGKAGIEVPAGPSHGSAEAVEPEARDEGEEGVRGGGGPKGRLGRAGLTMELPAARGAHLGRVRPARIAPDAPDEVLVAAMAQGDEDAVVGFVRRYERRVYGLAWTMLGDAGLAEEVAQEAFVRAWNHAATYDPRRAAASTWVLAIARNLAIDRVRLRRPLPVPADQLAALAGGVEGEFEEEPERRERLRLALATLPDDQRRAVVLAAALGYTAAEIGVVESIPLGTAKTRIRAGLTKLRRLLEPGEATP